MSTNDALNGLTQISRVIAETASDGIITIDENSTIVFANRATEKIFGYSREELIGHSLTMLMPEYLRHVHRAGLTRYMSTGKRHISWEAVELPGLHKNGSEIPLELSFGEFVEAGKRFFTGIVRDITDRKRAEEALRQSEEHLRALIENATDIITVLNRDGTRQYVSPSVERSIGYKPEELIGKSPFELIHSDNAAELRKVFIEESQPTRNQGSSHPSQERIVENSRSDRAQPARRSGGQRHRREFARHHRSQATRTPHDDAVSDGADTGGVSFVGQRRAKVAAGDL